MELVAFILFVVGAVLAGIQKGWALCAVAAGLAFTVAEAALKI